MKKVKVLLMSCVLAMVLTSVSYAAVDVDNIMIYNVFGSDEGGDDLLDVLNQVALSTEGIMFRVDEEIVEREIVVDWSEGKTLRGVLDYLVGVENVWGIVEDVIVVAPIDPDSTNFQSLCEPKAFSLTNTTAEQGLKLMDDYYARVCKVDVERNRIVVNAPPELMERIGVYLRNVVDAPRPKVILKSSTVFINKSSLGALGFRGMSYEWGNAVPSVDRQFAELIRDIAGGVYENDDASKLRLLIDMLIEKGVAVRETLPTVAGEAGSLIKVDFGKKILRFIRIPDEHSYQSYEIKEIEVPVSLSAVPWVNGDLITLSDLKIISSSLDENPGIPGGGVVVNQQILESRISLRSRDTYYVGGFSEKSRRDILNILPPGKRWKTEDVEVLMEITPILGTDDLLADKEAFIERMLGIGPEELTQKKKTSFWKVVGTLIVLYGAYELISD